jgi:hypothetical protein
MSGSISLNRVEQGVEEGKARGGQGRYVNRSRHGRGASPVRRRLSTSTPTNRR